MAVRTWQGWEPKEFLPTHCTQLIGLMSEGKGPEFFNADNNLSRATFYRWLDLYPDFKLAYDIGKEKGKKYMVKMLHEYTVDRGGTPDTPSEKLNIAVWKEIMKYSFQIPEQREAQALLGKIARGENVEELKPSTMMTTVLLGLRSGLYDTEEAHELAKLIETAQRVGEVSELSARLDEIEKALDSGSGVDEFKEEIPTE